MRLLHEILTAHGTKIPTGQPLYRYKLTAEHRARMAYDLAQHCAQNVTLAGQAAPLFCLYAADRLRSHLGAGVWTWATVTEPIGWRGSDGDLRRAVGYGVQWWNRPLFETAKGRRFLATLVTEGGGPLGLLRDAPTTTPLRVFLRRMLIDCERFQRPAADFVREHQRVLALSLQRETALEVFTALVDHVAALRTTLREIGPSAARDPVAALDQRDPAWRDRFVFDLADDVAQDLLRGLLREPSPVGATARNVPTVETRLEGDEHYTVVREVVLPGAPDAKMFLDAFGYALDPPGRLRIVAERADGTRTSLAVGTLRQSSPPTYAFERAGSARIDDPAVVRDAIVLVAMAGSRELGRMQPPGGEALEDDPWTFSAHHPRRLLGTSSLRTRQPCVWIAWREDLAHPAPSQGSLWKRLGALQLPGERRVVHSLEGSLRLERTGGDDVISTGEPVEDDWWYLEGRAWAGPGSIPGTTFVGIPEARGLNAEGVSHTLPRGCLTWQRAGATPVLAEGLCLGRGVLALRRQDRVALRVRATLLPADLVVETRALAVPDEGTVLVRSAHVVDVGVDPCEGLTTTMTREPGAVSLQVHRTSRTVSALSLTLRLRGGGDVPLRVDFPARWAGFVRGFDDELPKESRCSLERLGHIRAVARSHKPNDRFELMARVPGVRPWLSLSVLPDRAGRRELVLDTVADDITALLAQTNSIDDVVELGVLCVGVDAAPRNLLSVGRYDRKYDVARDADGSTVTMVQSAAVMVYAPDSVHLEARPLLDPQADPVVLPRAGEGWRFSYTAHAPGPWLLLAWRGDRLAVRPLLITSPWPDGTSAPPLEGLRAASSLGSRQARDAALDQRFAEMARDPFDADWTLVDDHVATMQALPAATFDLVSALVRHEDAVLIALLRAPSALRERVWSAFETLPLLWEMVSASAWARALGRIRDGWNNDRGLDPRGFRPWFDDLISFVERRGQMIRAQLEVAAAATDIALSTSTLEQAYQRPTLRNSLRALLEMGAIAVRERHDARLEWWPDDDIRALLHALPESERLQGHEAFQELVIHGPLLAAAFSAGHKAAISLDPAARDGLRVSLHRARSFDPRWFDEAASYWLTRLMLTAR